MPGTEETQAALSPEWQEQLLIEQIKECWADCRNYDVILWTIPAAISAIAGLFITATFQLGTTSYALWARPLLALAAATVTLPLIVALFKNRLFQIDRNNWRIALHDELVRGKPDPMEIQRIRTESKERVSLVPFSTPRLTHGEVHGPWYWRTLVRKFRDVRAFHVLFIVSLSTLVAELVLAIVFGYLLIHALAR